MAGRRKEPRPWRRRRQWRKPRTEFANHDPGQARDEQERLLSPWYGRWRGSAYSQPEPSHQSMMTIPATAGIVVYGRGRYGYFDRTSISALMSALNRLPAIDSEIADA